MRAHTKKHDRPSEYPLSHPEVVRILRDHLGSALTELSTHDGIQANLRFCAGALAEAVKPWRFSEEFGELWNAVGRELGIVEELFMPIRDEYDLLYGIALGTDRNEESKMRTSRFLKAIQKCLIGTLHPSERPLAVA